ncbi:transcription antitermination factor NusB [Paramaledivibacter caminithermalis]|jgi:N utilization substance protein B|uniref:Transcription antitermination protein NusB n=1 Tax=Paramaledivibacter caminithermalis (strain DSM 15212 / CIP 107654 / DViRD3) TaxID=1121301 RepID=A0A1M6JQR4_PARC5|nr:transcription antitermination factor NusB [Paramaledivibacter caminithermalis]SHJ49010.1 NusB antitermination factor [Paramaledivibacter caminithermalis DSM 15212]
MSRRMARETVMQVYYQMEIHKEYTSDVARKYIEGVVDNKNDRKYIDNMIDIFIKNKDLIDKNINDNLKGWNMERISMIDLSILRIGLCEILFRHDIPMKVSINEAIELGKKYGTDDSAAFISGLLGEVVSKEEYHE